MDTNNDSSQGAVPADQPVPPGRPNQYIGYTQRSVQPNVVAPRPYASPAAMPAPAPAPDLTPPPAPAAVEPIITEQPQPEPISEPIAVNVVAPAPAIAQPVQVSTPTVDVPVTPSPRPSLAPAQPSPSQPQPVGAPIDDFRPMPTPTPAPTYAAPVATPTPAPAAPEPSRPPVMNDVFTPPVRPFANPAAAATASFSDAPSPVVPIAEDNTDDQSDEDLAEEQLSHISNHLAAEAEAKPKKAHFSLFHHHPKATAALVALFVVLGGAGGFYVLKSGAKPNTHVVATWVSFDSKDAGFSAKYASMPKHVKLNSGDGYIITSTNGEYGVRALDGTTAPDTVISADAINYGNGKVTKQDYKTVSGNDAVSGTISGTYKGKPALVTFEFLETNKDLYELYTVGYGTQPAPNTQYFFTTFKPADTL